MFAHVIINQIAQTAGLDIKTGGENSRGDFVVRYAYDGQTVRVVSGQGAKGTVIRKVQQLEWESIDGIEGYQVVGSPSWSWSQPSQGDVARGWFDALHQAGDHANLGWAIDAVQNLVDRKAIRDNHRKWAAVDRTFGLSQGSPRVYRQPHSA